MLESTPPTGTALYATNPRLTSASQTTSVPAWPLALIMVGTLFPAKVNCELPAKTNFPLANLHACKESLLGLIVEKYLLVSVHGEIV